MTTESEQVDDVENRLRDLEVGLVRQEHRPLALLRNYWEFRKLPSSDARKSASVLALALNLLFSPAAAAGGAGLVTVVLLIWQNYLIVESNGLIRKSLGIGGSVTAQLVNVDFKTGDLDILVNNSTDGAFVLKSRADLYVNDEKRQPWEIGQIPIPVPSGSFANPSGDDIIREKQALIGRWRSASFHKLLFNIEQKPDVLRKNVLEKLDRIVVYGVHDGKNVTASIAIDEKNSAIEFDTQSSASN